MGAHGDNVYAMVMWTIGGFFLSLLLLFGLFGGLLLGFLLVLLVPLFALGFLVVAVLKGKDAKVGKEVAIKEITALEEAEAVADATQTPVAATIVVKEGVCPIAPCEIGDTWKMNGKLTGPDSLCFFGERLLSEKATQLRNGEISDGDQFECLGREFRTVFRIRRADAVGTATSE